MQNFLNLQIVVFVKYKDAEVQEYLIFSVYHFNN